MFINCVNLLELDISNWNTSKVKDMEEMFYGCSNLTNITGELDLSSCTNITNMFKDANSNMNLHL